MASFIEKLKVITVLQENGHGHSIDVILNYPRTKASVSSFLRKVYCKNACVKARGYMFDTIYEM